VSETGVDPTTVTTRAAEGSVDETQRGEGLTTTSAPAAGARGEDHWLDRLPAPLVAFGSVVAVGGTQGGYFPTMWGPSAAALLALVALWLLGSGRTDAGRWDAAFVTLFAALLGWVALSTAWSSAPSQSILDVERLLVPVAGTAAILVLSRRRSVPDVVLALALGATVLCGYGLATRLFPDQLGGTFEPIAGYRLSEPIGYWNGLGILAAIGLVLAVGAATDAGSLWRRVLASTSLVVLAPTLYFTYSRGAWIALGVGLAATLVVTPRRLVAVGSLALLAPAPALAVLAASRSHALTRLEATLGDAVAEGRDLFFVLVALGALAAAGAVALHVLSARLDAPPKARLALGSVLAVGVATGVVAVFAQWGAPWTLASDAVDAFQQPPAAGGADGDLNDRLFDFSGSGRVDLWRVALSTAQSEPLLGTGAGTFERYWQQDERWSFKARDAHNLYLETLAELGPVGLGLLVGLMALAFAACLAARRRPLVPVALGAFAAYAVHAGVDWDWELPAVTLAAFVAGSLGLVARRSGEARRLPRPFRTAAVVAVAAAAAVALLGFVANDSLERAEYALEVGNPSAAVREARLARRFAPWSPYPLTVRGEALLALGEVAEARVAFRDAIDMDAGYWRAWLGLGVASSGRARTVAIEEAKRLYPRSAEIEQTEELLREQAR
jgi:O-antigen ligase